jgi:hypothetical protein
MTFHANGEKAWLRGSLTLGVLPCLIETVRVRRKKLQPLAMSEAELELLLQTI